MPLSLRWSRWPHTDRIAPSPANLGASQELDTARRLQLEGRLAEAERAAEAALERQEELVGRNHAALVSYLLTLAGIRYARHGWPAARLPYERAQLLRGTRPVAAAGR